MVGEEEPQLPGYDVRVKSGESTPPLVSRRLRPSDGRDGFSTSGRPLHGEEKISQNGQSSLAEQLTTPASGPAFIHENGASPERDPIPSPTVPQIRIENDSSPAATEEGQSLSFRHHDSPPSMENSTGSFRGITLNLPSSGLCEDIPTESMEFSKRGSMLIEGRRANGKDQSAVSGLNVRTGSRRIKSNPSIKIWPNSKVLTDEEELLSQKVRSFYEAGSDLPSEIDRLSSLGHRIGLRWQATLNGADNGSLNSMSRATSMTDVTSDKSATDGADDHRDSFIQREDHELAGGLEDWEDVGDGDVDRYGFIAPKSPTSNPMSTNGQPQPSTTKDTRALQRISTSLQVAAETPRGQRAQKGIPRDATRGKKANIAPPLQRQPSTRSATGQFSSQGALHGSVGRHQSTLRIAANRLPHNKSRRLVDEAGDMLTAPPSSTGMTEDGQIIRSDRARRKENERAEKWRKMAKVVHTSNSGGGMIFDFDTQNSKLIERTWKGIPDRWRATAWYAFISASQKKTRIGEHDDFLINCFHTYMSHSSPDDVQIDLDVPRTINSHIMFRRRYRGGQRLLFRVLHAMSLHFPDTGYVQGMAALAATLLVYYEEERAFVMMVRVWELRGLDKLYEAGFGGLIEALDNLESRWMGKGDLNKRLNDLGITATAWGTRWYLTLFNYSIPFQAQLRVWDVFMLLGGDEELTSGSTRASGQFGTTLDVLHATSAALIDGMRDILLNSDFENAMKVLTSWIPIQDEDLFLQVVKAEWKMHKAKG